MKTSLLKTTLFLIAAIVLIGIAGCESAPSRDQPSDADIISTSHKAAVELMSRGGGVGDETIIVASFANIDDLANSSSLGRIVSQQFASAFTSNGYKVVEMLLRNNVYIATGKGEFLLSRQIKNLSSEHNASAVVVGVYAVGKDNVYVTSKMIRASDNVVLASHDFKLPLGPDTRSLVRR